MRNFIVFFVAISLDTFGLLISIAGSAISGAIGFVASFLNPAVSLIASGGGLIIGNIIEFCIDATFGTGFIALLIFNGLLTTKGLLSMRQMPNIVAKLIPGIDAIWPGYSILAWQSIRAKEHQERAARASTGAPSLSEESVEKEPYDEETSGDEPGGQPRGINQERGASSSPDSIRRNPVMADIRFTEPKTPANQNSRVQLAA